MTGFSKNLNSISIDKEKCGYCQSCVAHCTENGNSRVAEWVELNPFGKCID